MLELSLAMKISNLNQEVKVQSQELPMFKFLLFPKGKFSCQFSAFLKFAFKALPDMVFQDKIKAHSANKLESSLKNKI